MSSLQPLANIGRMAAVWTSLLVLSLWPAVAAADGDDRIADLTFDDIKFEMEKGADFERSMLTEDIEELAGKRIKLRGYIRPSFQQSGIKRFILVRDNQECCFGPGAMIYDCVLVSLSKGTEIEYTVRPIVVEGQFYLKEYKGPDGKVWAIFRMKKTELVK